MLVDQRNGRHQAVVERRIGADALQIVRVQQVDDLHVARQQALDERHRPAFQRLRQQRVVRVGEGVPRDLPRRVPIHAALVDEQAHQLGHGDGGMRVVELDRDMLGEGAHVLVLGDVPPEQILQRGGGEEELLPEPEFLPRRRGVARIEHLRHGLQPHPLGQRADVIAAVEGVEPEWIARPRGPEPERVHVAAAPADDRRVIGDGVDALRRLPDMAERAVDRRHRLDGAAETNGIGHFGPLEFPRIAERQPVLGIFELPAILDALAEEAVIVADAVAVGGDRERGHAFHEAGREPSEATVAERRIRLERAQRVQIDAVTEQRHPRRRREAEIAERVAQQAADQELEGEVIDALAARRVDLVRGVHPPVDDPVAGGEHGRDQPVPLRSAAGILAHLVGELGEDRLAKGLDVAPRRRLCWNGLGARGRHGSSRQKASRSMKPHRAPSDKLEEKPMHVHPTTRCVSDLIYIGDLTPSGETCASLSMTAMRSDAQREAGFRPNAVRRPRSSARPACDAPSRAEDHAPIAHSGRPHSVPGWWCRLSSRRFRGAQACQSGSLALPYSRACA